MTTFYSAALHTRFISFFAVLLFMLPLAEPMHARQNQDLMQRRAQQVNPVQTPSFDMSGVAGSFYFLDQFGINLGMSRMSGDAIDPATYRVGPGDLVTIVLTGNQSGTFRGLHVNPQGMVTLPNVGSVLVNNMLIEEAQAAVNELVRRSFRDTQATFTIERPRQITVHIAGDVPNPGSYFMPAHTRLDQAVLPAFFEREQDGEEGSASASPAAPSSSRISTRPQPDASRVNVRNPAELPNLSRDFILNGRFAFRNIEIRRAGGDTVHGDLVSYTVGGLLTGNPELKHGDVVLVRKKQEFAPQVSVSGSVVSPFTAEFRADDTIESLIAIAGGFTFDADTEAVQVHRFTMNGMQRIEVRDPAGFPLLPNDRIVVGFDADRRSNFSARVEGEANLPGVFPIERGVTTAADLLELAGGLSPKANAGAARLTRNRASWERLPDELNPFAYNADRIRRASDQLVEGFEYLEFEDRLGQNFVFIDLSDPEQLATVKIYENDVLHIPRDQQSVFVFGQVMNSGFYTFTEGTSVQEYIRRAGGFALASDPDRVFVIKAGSNAWMRPSETTLQSGDLIFVDRQPFESLDMVRENDFRRRELRNRNIQLVLSGLATITSVITAYVAITR
ncbi:MAG: SLBB domain-containing protein [Candidatus Cyclonatronum sp.]|uniref:SLBB domain-containing protein n=1 Tax=Cyclonatronum sp. TaxID=3024185 RepID=UPI0025B836AD|nr:SLBB domain-containing protein [Cyclonatronum sp.]MCH8485442.1 SLBB domain-containing protein [Cyclonatronum sp.]